MKKISLSVIAIVFACATVFAGGPISVAKKAKPATCTACPKDGKCDKGSCPKTCSDPGCCK